MIFRRKRSITLYSDQELFLIFEAMLKNPSFEYEGNWRGELNFTALTSVPNYGTYGVSVSFSKRKFWYYFDFYNNNTHYSQRIFEYSSNGRKITKLLIPLESNARSNTVHKFKELLNFPTEKFNKDLEDMIK